MFFEKESCSFTSISHSAFSLHLIAWPHVKRSSEWPPEKLLKRSDGSVCCQASGRCLIKPCYILKPHKSPHTLFHVLTSMYSWCVYSCRLLVGSVLVLLFNTPFGLPNGHIHNHTLSSRALPHVSVVKNTHLFFKLSQNVQTTFSVLEL